MIAAKNEVICSYDPETKGGDSADDESEGTIQWVDAKSIPTKVRLTTDSFQNQILRNVLMEKISLII